MGSRFPVGCSIHKSLFTAAGYTSTLSMEICPRQTLRTGPLIAAGHTPTLSRRIGTPVTCHPPHDTVKVQRKPISPVRYRAKGSRLFVDCLKQPACGIRYLIRRPPTRFHRSTNLRNHQGQVLNFFFLDKARFQTKLLQFGIQTTKYLHESIPCGIRLQ